MRAILTLLVGLVLGAAATYFIVAREKSAPVAPAAPERKALYWYDPMQPAQHFDKPGKSPYMDMALVPKYADEAAADGAVSIDPRLVQSLGVRTAKATRGTLDPPLTATGTLAFDERDVSVVEARAAGIVESLAVRAPMSPVARGQALMTLRVPEWTAAQAEYLALRGGSLRELAGAARQRLLLLGMDEARIAAIEKSGSPQARIVVVAPRAGVVAELAVREGASVMAGAPIARIDGLERVWVEAAIPEAQLARVASGARVDAQVPAFPETKFEGVVDALLPRIDPATRTQTARIVLDNRAAKLVPGMSATLSIAAAPLARDAVLVPSEAIIATGKRSVVLIAEGGGRFRAQAIHAGASADGRTVVVDGVDAGDEVVLSGQFLIDSEASLSASVKRLESEAP